MPAIRVFHRAFSGLLALFALGLIAFFAHAALKSVPEVTDPDYGWDAVGEAVMQASEPAEYRDFEYFEADATPENLEAFAGDNGFVATTGIQMLVGLCGLGLMYTALARRPTGRWIMLHMLAVVGVVVFAFFLFGFNLAYPGEFSLGGFLPAWLPTPFIVDPDADPFDYGMSFTIWTDFFYQSLYAVLVSCLVLSLSLGRFRGPTVMVVAIAAGAFGFPLTTSWLWGGGWLSEAGALDFAGSAMIHLLAGGTALGMVLLGRVCPPAGPGFSPSPSSTPIRDAPFKFGLVSALLFVVGTLVFLFLIVGVNAGSVLANDTPVVAAVLHATTCSVAGGAVAAGLVSLPLAGRSRLAITVVGALGGWAAICASADAVSSSQAFGVGALAGGLAALVLYGMDRLDFDDPFGVVSISLVGGGVGMLAAGVFSEDAVMWKQAVAAFSVAAIGLAIGGSLGLVAWLARVLREPPKMSLPDTATANQ